MPLTPADVHNVAFKKPSIGKRGYDEDEVDAFLDVVEAEMARLIEENAELKAKTDQVAGGHTVPLTKPAAEAAPMSAGDAHTAAARLLGLAQETADKLTTEARAEAERVTGEASAQAEKTVSEANSQAEALLADATARAEAAERDSRTKAENLDREAKTRYDEAIGKLSNDRVGLEKKIEDLRGYEKEYRGRLKSWISDQLAQLDDSGSREQQPVAVTSGPGD
ncbi:DivIVA domain-containing protein [Nakamurella sp.]|uniref:DivIVA domain-containing protein n=1 Tax=Nakamurella sp. TaxID=1869182 RepID=UPI00378376FA